jgi:hypothetical protein
LIEEIDMSKREKMTDQDKKIALEIWESRYETSSEFKILDFVERFLAARSVNQEPVAEVNRYGKDSHGRAWHGINWYDPDLNVPSGTKLFIDCPN